MKTTIFKPKHEAMGGRMVPFAGFYMPVQFDGVITEHETVRKAVGVFDVSHMGEIWVRGEKALELLQRVSSNDASKLSVGKVQYSCLPNETGGIVDDLLVYRFDEHQYLLVVNAANIEKDWAWINRQNEGIGASLENASDNFSQLAVQGPLALKTLQKLTEENLGDIPFYAFRVITLAERNNVVVSNTGYTGSGGFEVYFANESGHAIYEAILEAGHEYGIKPIGLAARDTLRLEMGYCLYGNDIDETTSPIEAGLGWITKLTENKPLINREHLINQVREGVEKKLIGFELTEKGIPRSKYAILDEEGQQIGVVTSGTMSPSLRKAIGMGYVAIAKATPGEEIYIDIRGKATRAKVVKRPFYQPA